MVTVCSQWSCSVVCDSAIPWTVAYQAPPSVEFSRQEYWSGLLFPSPDELPNQRIKPRSPTWQADTLPSELPGKPSSQWNKQNKTKQNKTKLYVWLQNVSVESERRGGEGRRDTPCWLTRLTSGSHISITFGWRLHLTLTFLGYIIISLHMLIPQCSRFSTSLDLMKPRKYRCAMRKTTSKINSVLDHFYSDRLI